MRNVIVSVAALVAAGGSALAQTDFRLDLSLAARDLSSGVVTDLGTNTQVNAVVGHTYRVELRYRIADLKADNVGSRGLATAYINIATSGDGASQVGGMTRSRLTSHQSTSSNLLNPDDTGLVSGMSGLIGRFRDGLNFNDNAPLNAVPTTAGFNILPLAFDNIGFLFPAMNQNSWNGTNPTATNTNSSTAQWALYSFDFVYGGGTVNFSADAPPDPESGNRFSFYTRTGFTNNATPITANASTAGQVGFTSGSISFIPAPAGASLLALAGLAAARRRRA